MSLDVLPPRYRERDSRTDTAIAGSWGNGVGGSGPVHYTAGYEGVLATIYDTPHSQFRKLIKSGAVVLGDLVIYRCERKVSPGTYSCNVPESGGYHCTVSGDITAWVEQSTFGVPALPNLGDAAKMETNVQIKAFAKMNAAPVLVGEILNDMDKTIAGFRKPFGSAQDLLRRMSKYRIKHAGKTAASFARATANSWLEYRYGWSPIIHDCQTIVKETHNLRQKIGRKRLVARAGERSTNTVSKSFSRQPTVRGTRDGHPWLATGSMTRKHEIRVSAGVIYDLANRTTLEELQRIFGTTPSDMVATLWEIVPWSFVVDWFVNVGDWLGAITPNPYVNVRGSWITTVEKTTDTYSGGLIEEFYDIWPYPRYTATGSWGASEICDVSIKRDCNRPIATHPTLTTSSLSALRQADAMSLLVRPVITALQGFKH